DPDILLADEPTGALDSETSVQIMELLKKIAKKKLVIMVTHNPELAEKYSTRIIKLKDGKIISDSNPYDGKVNTKEDKSVNSKKSKKTGMSFLTALSLSFNNLMTKKGRTILVAFAGSIGIIGIALILAVSTGFQNYVDSIQEDTLTSYPLTIMQESTDITGMLLAMTSGERKNKGTNKVTEEQFLTKMLGNVKANDLKSFKKYLEDNYKKVDKDISTVKYSYSIDPMIYTYDATGKLAKLNPSNLFSSIYNSSMLSSYSSFGSIFSQMVEDYDNLNLQYDMLAGRWPKEYNEMIIVLSEPNGISDLLVYSLGLRDNKELTDMVTKIMSGEAVNIDNEPLELTYEDLMNVKLKLIMPSDTYRYNNNYGVYEDMSEDDEFMKGLYDKSIDLKIVGIVSAKEGTTSMALTPGVGYTSKLIDYIIDYSSNSNLVKKQLENKEVDVFSGSRFDSKNNNIGFGFEDVISIDSNKLASAFNMQIDENQIKEMTNNYMTEISNSIKIDPTPAINELTNTLYTFEDGLFATIEDTFTMADTDELINNYLNSYEVGEKLKSLEEEYVIPKDTYKTVYSGLLKGLLTTYIASYYAYDQSLTEDPTNPVVKIDETITEMVKNTFNGNASIAGAADTLGKAMTEAKIKKEVMTKVGELIGKITSSIASSFNVDEDAISSAFSLNFTEDELMRVVGAMMNKKDTTAKSNLISLGYQDKEEPTFISFYFNSFDGKEHFLDFIDKYNKKMEKDDEDKVINYSDTTGILMNSVKTIVNAVSYVLIAFVSISLVVSSIMIGIITYISVYERTKEIGILRSIGASKRNISSIFNAETFIIGFLSGLFGIGISYTLIPIINSILHHYTGNIPLSASLAITSALLLVGLSIILTLIGGLIPARAASKKDPVEALRSE
ncbi:MAG: FtsX-like permease family protein, partial [Bacilli bacterium]|nr:FtsX-like permease family protein [Bacilli bacterium]